MIKVIISEYSDESCPICLQRKIREFFQDWHPSKFCTEVYTYVCNNCGVIARKEVNLLAKDGITWTFKRF